MYRSAIDDSVTYYSTDIPTNFVRSPRVGVFDSQTSEIKSGRVDTAQVVIRIGASLPRALWKHGGTGYRKKRPNRLTDSLDQDSLLEETEDNTNDKGDLVKNSLMTSNVVHSASKAAIGNSVFTIND